MSIFQTWVQLLWFSLIAFPTITLHADDFPPRVDSLEAVVADHQQDHHARLSAAISLSRALFRDDVLASQGYARQAIRLGRALGAVQQEGEGLVYLAIGYSIRSMYDSSRYYLSQAEKIALQADEPRLKASVYNNLGIINFRLGANQEAIADYARTLAAYQQLGDTLGMAKVYNNLGNAYQAIGKFDQAVALFEQSIAIKEAAHYEQGLGQSRLNLGLLHFHRQHYRQAFDELYAAREIFEEHDERLNVISIYANLGSIYQSLGHHEVALNCFRYALTLQEEMGVDMARARMLNNLGLVERALGMKGFGVARLEDAICQQRELGDSLGLANSYFHLAEVHFEDQRYDQARRYALGALALANRNDYWEPKLHAHRTLGQLAAVEADWRQVMDHAKALIEVCTEQHIDGYIEHGYLLMAEAMAGLGDYQAAYHYEKRVRNMSDSTTDRAGLQAALRQELDFYLENKKERWEVERRLLVTQQEQQLSYIRDMRNILLIVILVLLMIAIFFYVNYLQKRRHNQLLHSRQQELRQKNEDLLRLHEEKNQLLGVFTHDLRTPVTQIQALNQQLMELHPSADKLVQRFQQSIAAAADRLSNTIDRILALNAMETHGLSLSPEVLAPVQLMQEVTQSMQASFDRKNLRVTWHTSAENCEVWADRNLMREIFENLIGNAIKFSPAGKGITLGSYYQGEKIVFFVQDEGPGIHPQDVPKLFGKFQRLRAKPTGGESSTGLGLAIVQQYATRMDGRVWCESEWGEGATFFLAFDCFRFAKDERPLWAMTDHKGSST